MSHEPWGIPKFITHYQTDGARMWVWHEKPHCQLSTQGQTASCSHSLPYYKNMLKVDILFWTTRIPTKSKDCIFLLKTFKQHPRAPLAFRSRFSADNGKRLHVMADGCFFFKVKPFILERNNGMSLGLHCRANNEALHTNSRIIRKKFIGRLEDSKKLLIH